MRKSYHFNKYQTQQTPPIASGISRRLEPHYPDAKITKPLQPDTENKNAKHYFERVP
nr:MAG TPA_asm: hypothetical protein [Bacteriophage sp.]